MLPSWAHCHWPLAIAIAIGYLFLEPCTGPEQHSGDQVRPVRTTEHPPMDPTFFEPFLGSADWANDSVAHPYKAFGATPDTYVAVQADMDEITDWLGCDVYDANTNPSLGSLYRFQHPALSATETCEGIIYAAEVHAAANGGWTRSRHVNYPATDLEVRKIPALEHIFDSVREAVFPFVERVHGLGRKNWRFNDLFIVKYEHGRQSSLPNHQDTSTFSFTVLLNRKTDFAGGGTYYDAFDRVIQPEQGEILIHLGSMEHEGRPITQGVRYLLIGFLGIKDDCYNDGFDWLTSSLGQAHVILSDGTPCEAWAYLRHHEAEIRRSMADLDDYGRFIPGGTTHRGRGGFEGVPWNLCPAPTTNPESAPDSNPSPDPAPQQTQPVVAKAGGHTTKGIGRGSGRGRGRGRQ